MIRSVESGIATEYVYRGHDPLYEKTGTTSTLYFYANGRMVAKLTGSDTFYYIRDALGSTRQVWKHGATSSTFSVATYKPFGTPMGASGTEKFQYAGEMLVGVAGTSPGLYYIGARWMAPELGRWLSLDPELGSLSAPQTMDRYVYSVNNPLRFTRILLPSEVSVCGRRTTGRHLLISQSSSCVRELSPIQVPSIYPAMDANAHAR